MSEAGELAAVLGPGSVVLVQASTPVEERLIRQRVAAAGAADQVTASLGPAGTDVPGEVLDRGDETVLPGDVAAALGVGLAFLEEAEALRG